MTDNRFCENTSVHNSREYKLEKVWRIKKSDKSVDIKGVIYPYPKEGVEWTDRKLFINRLGDFEKFLNKKKRYVKYDKHKNCILCGEQDISTKLYYYSNIMWEDGLIHYIKKHLIEPSVQFKQMIFNNEVTATINRSTRNEKINEEHANSNLIARKVMKKEHKYVMIERNQLLVLDALMIHGGYEKRYIDVTENFSRYSEHAGCLDFENESLSKIVVSGKTTRIDEGDEDIYLPMNMEDMFNYEYIFHTHPPTPKPGGRAADGILYEFPSIGDIYHFIDHHNGGNVIGSLVITAEGLYNIHKYSADVGDIIVNDEQLFRKYQKMFNNVQERAINTHGTKFNTKYFYSTIAQDTEAINSINSVLNDFDIQIDYYPRKKDTRGRWVIDTVFLVFRENRKR